VHQPQKRLPLHTLRGTLESQAAQRRGERRARLRVGSPELGQAGCEPLRGVERDERSFEAGTPEKPHGSGVELVWIIARDQGE
jgi:hypothetical protein